MLNKSFYISRGKPKLNLFGKFMTENEI